MNSNFCTGCGYAVSVDGKFCEECGVVFSNKTKPDVAEMQRVPANPLPSTFITWIDVGGKSLAFGAPMVAIFNFLSPRVALLPVAAIIAVVGLLSAIALRKFVAPNLPVANKFRAALAPDVQLHKSPFLIATGLLSALMVTGAAWSSSNAVKGGVIASSFDAAKNAQMQLGVMQGLQKEQRMQTAVLEDIRDGRTINPRRELANQGITWDGNGFGNAIESSDITVIQLFLNGGMRWRLHNLERSVERGNQKIMALFLQYPTLLDADDERDCWSSAIHVRLGKLESFRKKQLKYEPQPVPVLTATDKGFLKLFCTATKDVAYLSKELKSEAESYDKRLLDRSATMDSVGISASPGTRRTSIECKRDLLANNAKLLLERANTFVAHEQRCGGIPCYGYAIASDQLLYAIKEKNSRGASLLTEHMTPDIEKYCESNSGQESPFDDFDMQVLKQIIDSLS